MAANCSRKAVGEHRQVYADNAATTQLSHAAFEAMTPFLLDQYANPSQSYSFSRIARKALDKARATIADCIGALPEEIFFTSGGTESDNWVIQGAAKQQMKIITSAIEHHAILAPCAFVESKGSNVEYLPVDSVGLVHPQTLADTISGNGHLVSFMYANNEIGTIEPIEELAAIAHRNDALFHTDAVQAVGHTHIDVKRQNIDMLSASAHKFNGPKGVGFLFIRNGIKWPPLIMGGMQENYHRAGTENVASIVGMATALQENIAAIDDNCTRLKRLEKRLLDELSAAKLVFIRNGSTNHIAGNISLSFPGFEGEMLLHRLDLLGISVSTGSACDSQNTQISHVLKAIGLPYEYAKCTIRISLGRYNTEHDVCAIATAIERIVGHKP